MAKEITNRIVSVTRRGFLGKASNVLAASAATVVPFQLVKSDHAKRAEMASALHDAVDQLSEAPAYVQVHAEGRTINLETEILLGKSEEEIEILLLPLFGGVS